MKKITLDKQKYDLEQNKWIFARTDPNKGETLKGVSVFRVAVDQAAIY